MRAPGTDRRTTEDRSCDIACRCGAVLTTLAAGERVVASGSAQIRTITCLKCGTVTKLRIVSDPAPSDG